MWGRVGDGNVGGMLAWGGGPGIGHSCIQWCSVITRFGRVCVKNIVMIIGSGVGVGLRVKAYTLILELINSGRANDAVMYHMSGIFSKNLESHGISDIGGDANPPACFLFGRWEGLIGVEVENSFVESIFKEGGDILQSTMLKFTWDLISNGFVSTYVVNIGNVLTSKQPTIFRCTCPIKENL